MVGYGSSLRDASLRVPTVTMKGSSCRIYYDGFWGRNVSSEEQANHSQRNGRNRDAAVDRCEVRDNTRRTESRWHLVYLVPFLTLTARSYHTVPLPSI